MLRRNIVILSVLALLASMVFAVAPAVAQEVGYSWVRVAHASPDAPAVDVWVDGQKAVINLEFSVVTGYLLLPAGDHNIQVTPTGATTPVVIDADVTLEKNEAYTVAATGLLADIAPEVYVDDNAWPAPGSAKVRFIHLSPDAPAVDVGVAGGAVLFDNIAFKEASDYIEVPADTYDLDVRLQDGTVVLDVPDVDLEAGNVYTVFAEGLAAGDPDLQAVLASFTPKGHVWYLAEGCTGPDFETWVLVQNPNDVAATVGLTFMTEEGAKAGPSATLEPNSRNTWKVNDYVTSWQVSTLVTANQPVVAERAMYSVSRTWAHDSIGVVAPAETWYLAEGATQDGFETFILVQNPNDEEATVTLTFMTEDGEVAGPTQELAPHSRYTWKANDFVTTFHVSTTVTSNQPVISERAMYGNNRTWAHDSIGYAP